MLGSSGSPDSLNALTTLVGVLADPAKLSAAVNEFKAAKAAAEDAQIKASAKIAEANAAMAKSNAERAALDLKGAALTKQAEDQTARGMALEATARDLALREERLSKQQSAFLDQQAVSMAAVLKAQKDAETKIANAEAALAERASRLKAAEDVLSIDRARFDHDKAALDARVKKIAQAVA